MIAGRNKNEAAALGAKCQSDVQSSSTFKIIFAEPSNPKTRMEMRLAKTVTRLIDRLRNLPALRLWHLSHLGAKRF